MANGTIQFFLPHYKTVAFILCRLIRSPFCMQLKACCHPPVGGHDIPSLLRS